jgi:hypothetical protein
MHDIGQRSQGLLGGKPSEEVGRREKRDPFVGTELKEVRIPGHETVRAAADGTGEEVIVVRVVLDNGGRIMGFDGLRELPKRLVDLLQLGIGQPVLGAMAVPEDRVGRS